MVKIRAIVCVRAQVTAESIRTGWHFQFNPLFQLQIALLNKFCSRLKFSMHHLSPKAVFLVKL